MNRPIERSIGNQVERPTTRRSDVHAAAATLFRRKGYAGASTRELASALGMRSASLYHHIGSKDDLLFGVCVESVERMRAALQDALAATDEPVAQIRALIAAHVNAMLSDRDALATMLIELRSLPEERRREVVELRDEYEALVRGALERAQAAGTVRPDIPARSLTLALLSLLNWPIFWFRSDGKLTPEELADLLASLFLEGALATRSEVDDGSE